MEHPNGEPTKPGSDAPLSNDPPAPSKPASDAPLSNDSPVGSGSGSANPDPDPAEELPSAGVKSPKSVRWSEQLVSESTFTPSNEEPRPSSETIKERMDGVRSVLGRWGSSVKDAAKKAETLAGNTWQHLKTNPSFTDAAMGRLAHSTKVIAEGGYDKIFRQTFETAQDELLKSSYACYLSTSAGPVMGALYLSTAKVAFCSDNPLPYKNGDQTEWSYYKVVIPLHQLKAFNPSTSRMNPAEKYIQVISVDNHEFWYMGFLNYENAVDSLQEALQASSQQSV